VPLAPLALRRAERWRARRSDHPFGWRSPGMVRAASHVAATAAVWAVATALGALLLMLPPGAGEGLPGARVDAALVAHAVPPLSRVAAERLVTRLEQLDGVGRWSPPGEMERRLVLAARIDPRTDRAVQRLVKARLRTRAGGFALGRPTPVTCDEGLRALAEALRGGALHDLMTACRNAPGDGVGEAAFVVGDFLRAVGPEAESIVSRQPRAPAGEPSCFAGGHELPMASLPVCRVVHAELKPETRDEVLESAIVATPFVARWLDTWRSEEGAPLPRSSRWVIDPVELLQRAGLALRDVPIAAYEDQRVRSAGSGDAVDRAWMTLAVSAERSAAGRHALAATLVDEALALLDGAAATEEDREAAARLAVVVALRGGRRAEAEAIALSLADDDVVRTTATRPPRGDDPGWRGALARGEGGEGIAEALERDGEAASIGLVDLDRVAEAERPPLREWLREAFPACHGCRFHRRLEHHEARLDAARALGDDELVEALEPIVARFEAVLLNRGLALPLRVADGE
jgi:hypothetical protein